MQLLSSMHWANVGHRLILMPVKADTMSILGLFDDNRDRHRTRHLAACMTASLGVAVTVRAHTTASTANPIEARRSKGLMLGGNIAATPVVDS